MGTARGKGISSESETRTIFEGTTVVELVDERDDEDDTDDPDDLALGVTPLSFGASGSAAGGGAGDAADARDTLNKLSCAPSGLALSPCPGPTLLLSIRSRPLGRSFSLSLSLLSLSYRPPVYAVAATPPRLQPSGDRLPKDFEPAERSLSEMDDPVLVLDRPRCCCCC